MADISSSVGSGGKNVEADVQEVQTLLNMAPVSEGGPSPPIDIDGWCGSATTKAILAFQKAQKFKVQDGRVDPGKATITRLNELTQSPDARQVAAPDLDPAQLAQQSIPQASIWANAGLTAVRAVLEQVRKSGGLGGVDDIVKRALAGHFKIVEGMTRARLEQLLKVVEQNFVGALGVFTRSAVAFRSVSRKQMNIDFGGKGDAPGYVLPLNRTKVNWSQLFRVRSSGPRPGLDWTGDGFGPKCRAAMVLHEPLHMVDSRGGLDIYEHSPGYMTMSADNAVHNAASYPSFAAHVQERSSLPLGPLYGAGRPAD